MNLEESKLPEEIQEEYMVLWKSIVDEVVAKFGAKIEFTKNKRDVPRVQLVNQQNEKIGYIDFSFLNRDAIYIEDSFTETPYIKSGVYTALQAILLLEYPHIRVIVGDLGFTNLKQYNQSKKMGKSQDEAIKETPAYKSRVKLGFSQIESKDSKLICHRDDQVINS